MRKLVIIYPTPQSFKDENNTVRTMEEEGLTVSIASPVNKNINDSRNRCRSKKKSVDHKFLRTLFGVKFENTKVHRSISHPTNQVLEIEYVREHNFSSRVVVRDRP